MTQEYSVEVQSDFCFRLMEGADMRRSTCESRGEREEFRIYTLQRMGGEAIDSIMPVWRNW
jgi:hypothetical protein